MDIIFYFISASMLFQNVLFVISFFGFWACLIVFIYNLQNGIKGKWPAKHIVGTIVSGFFMVACAIFVFVYICEFIFFLFTRTPGIPAGSSSSLESQIVTLLPLL